MKMKNKIYWAVGVVALAVIGYAVWVSKKKKAGSEEAKAPSGTGAPSGPASAWLKNGSRGNEVKALQRFLNQKGWNPALVEDGIFGPKTETAVKAVFGKTSISRADWEAREEIQYP